MTHKAFEACQTYNVPAPYPGVLIVPAVVIVKGEVAASHFQKRNHHLRAGR